MRFEERLQVASLVLEYAKVAPGYPVTLPVLVIVLCRLFHAQVARDVLERP